MSVCPPPPDDSTDASSGGGQGLGAFLRQKREAKGLTLDQVSAATKINLKVLQNLEADDYASLPAKPFIRGFVNSYARFIGLDAREVLLQFDRYLDEQSHARPRRDSGHSGYAFEKREGADSSRVMLAAVMGGTLVIGLGALVLLKPQLRGHKATQVERLKQLHEARLTQSPAPLPEPSAAASGTVIGPQASPKPSTSAAGAVPAASPTPTPSASATPSPSPTVSPSPSWVIYTPPGYVVPSKPLVLVTHAAPTPTPSVVPTPSPSPTPSVSPHAEQKPVEPKAEPTTTPTPAPSAAPSPKSSEKPDPLQSGIHLKGSEIQYKLIIQATGGDVWVRYRLDERPEMRFILRKDKILVLRAANVVRFQTSHWENLSFRLNGGPARAFNEARDLVTRGSGKTYVLPTQQREINEDFMTSRAELPKWIPESPRAASESAAPTE